MSTRINLYIDVPGDDRGAVLERRDELVRHLSGLGVRLSMTDDGTYVYLVDDGLPTLGEQMTRGPAVMARGETGVPFGSAAHTAALVDHLAIDHAALRRVWAMTGEWLKADGTSTMAVMHRSVALQVREAIGGQP